LESHYRSLLRGLSNTELTYHGIILEHFTYHSRHSESKQAKSPSSLNGAAYSTLALLCVRYFPSDLLQSPVRSQSEFPCGTSSFRSCAAACRLWENERDRRKTHRQAIYRTQRHGSTLRAGRQLHGAWNLLVH
jgi:hypothetical protein